MDKIDRKILSLLQENARYPLKYLAQKVFLSSPAVSTRIERMEKAGIITGYHATIDPVALGYHITAFINLTLDPKQKNEFYPYVTDCPNVLECNCVTGTYSIMLKVAFPSTMELDTFIGRSMVNVVNISMELGYLKIPEGVLIDIDESNNYTPDKIVIITTGSQGEPMSALTRMAMSDHKKVDIVPGDTVIISATPIPGNEKLVSRTIDHLYKLGADVIYEKSNGVHVSGHASQEEIKMMHNLVRPKFFIPVHGEYRHLIKHAQLAGSLGMPRENIVVGENGSIIELTRNSIGINGRVPSGKVLVDGLGVGDVGNIVLRDRRQLSQDGIMIVVVTIDKDTCTVVSGPDIVSRGFVYVREAEGLMETAKEKVQQALDKCEQSNVSEWSVIKSAVRDSLGRFLYEKTRRRPMILPIIMEI